MLASELAIQSLVDVGAQLIFGIPGAQILPIYDALSRCPQLRLVLMRHEQAAVHAADGYARLTGRPGFVLVTSGPGATNTVTGIATAYMDSVPLVVITGQVPTSAIGTDAFQEADITTITLPITKHSYLVKDAGKLQQVVEEAVHIASSGRPGPVLIDIPNNIQIAEVTPRPTRTAVQLPSYKPTIKGNARQIRQAADLLLQAQRPLIMAGGGILKSGAHAELLRLAELLQAPVATTLMARAIFPDSSQLSLGLIGMHGSSRCNRAIRDCDLLLALGTRFSDRSTTDAASFAPDARIIHCDIDPAEIGKNIRVDVPIVGDLKSVLGDLLARLAGQQTDTPVNWVCDDAASLEIAGQARNDQNTQNDALNESGNHNFIAPQAVFHELNKLLDSRPGDYLFTTDVGQHQIWAAQYLKLRGSHSFITSGGLGTMGFGLPAAIGVQLASPRSTVFCISGDGSLQMNSQEMATAAIHNLPIKLLVFDNRALGMVRQWQHYYYQDNFANSNLAAIPDFVALAQAYTWNARDCQSGADLQESLLWLLTQTNPALLNLRISRDAMVLPMPKTPEAKTQQAKNSHGSRELASNKPSTKQPDSISANQDSEAANV